MSILIVSGVEGIETCADAAAKQLGTRVDVAEGRRAALRAMGQREFAVVVVDESLVQCDPDAADTIWDRSELAIPLQVNFALCDASRLVREIRAALHRREREQAAAEKAAIVAVESEIRNTVTGLLLHSELALAQAGVPGPVAEKLRLINTLAGTLRELLSEAVQEVAAPKGRVQPMEPLRRSALHVT